jgi:ketosteroid isomerase-like protein
MSRENVDLVRRLWDTWNRRDHEAVFAHYDEDIEWRGGELLQVPDAEPVYRGHEGVRTFWRTWLAAWEEVSYEAVEFRDAGDHVVALVENQHMRGRTSGVDLTLTYAQVWTLRDGKVVRMRSFADQDEALRSVGLEPE